MLEITEKQQGNYSVVRNGCGYLIRLKTSGDEEVTILRIACSNAQLNSGRVRKIGISLYLEVNASGLKEKICILLGICDHTEQIKANIQTVMSSV